MSMSSTTLETFHAAGLDVCDLEKKGRGVIAKRHFKCGEVLLQERGFRANTMEKLASLVQASEEGWHAVADMFGGPLHHLHSNSQIDDTHDEEWMDMYSKVRFNSFLLDGNSTLLPNMALFNHSCQPNAAVVSLEPGSDCCFAMVVVAEEGIACGQEAVLCYDSELMFAPMQSRRRQLMSGWNFLCKCECCEAEAAKDASESVESPVEEADGGEEYQELVSATAEHLCDLRLFANRGNAMHQPQVPFGVRRQLFGTQLAAACSILPHLHPRLRDVYLQLKDLCGPSAHRDHCDRVCLFYESLCNRKEAVWADDAVVVSQS